MIRFISGVEDTTDIESLLATSSDFFEVLSVCKLEVGVPRSCTETFLT